MTGNQLNRELEINALSARYRRTGDWYHPLVSFPGVLFDINGYVIFRDSDYYNSCPNIDHGQDIHIRDGISNIEGYQLYSENERIIVNRLMNDFEGVLRIQREYSTYHRNQQNVIRVKSNFNNACAICNEVIRITNDRFYSEAHHIKPLSENGPDTEDNMICVCPTCHVKLDLRIIAIEFPLPYNPNNHNINTDYIEYHNNRLINLN